MIERKSISFKITVATYRKYCIRGMDKGCTVSPGPNYLRGTNFREFREFRVF